MQFNDTTNKNGIIQDCEFWTNFGDAGISGNTTLLKVFTSRINQSYDRLMPYLLSYLHTLGYDDSNNTGIPSRTTNLTSGTSVYAIPTDANSLAILVLANVAILPTSSATDYTMLEQITADDATAPFYISPNPSMTGVPTKILIQGNTVYFDRIPNYSATSGIKSFYTREQYRFASTDTTKVPGIPVPFQGLLPMYASHDWLLVNKPDNQALLTRLEAEIAQREIQLAAFIDARNPTRIRVMPGYHNNK